jgi:hypothetical protein
VVWQEEVRKRSLMKRIALKMTGNSVSRSFEVWSSNVAQLMASRDEAEAEERRKQDLMKRIAGRILYRCLSVCLEAWAEHTAEEVEKRNKMRRLVLRMTGNVEAKMFALWLEYLEVLQNQAVEEERRQGICIYVRGYKIHNVVYVLMHYVCAYMIHAYMHYVYVHAYMYACMCACMFVFMHVSDQSATD